jgi:alpha-beta hydrolase superfamily lysophospholipase
MAFDFFSRLSTLQQSPGALSTSFRFRKIGSTDPYPQLTAALHRAGIATVVLHPRGVGFSDGVRGDIDDYGLVLGDLQLGLERAKRTFQGKPVFLFGHSAGGVLALHVAAKARAPIAGVVLVNPAYKLKYSEGMGPSLGDFIAFAFHSVFRRSALTVDMNRNPSAVKHPLDREEAVNMQRDPVVVRYFSMRYLLGQNEVMKACLQNAAAVTAPLLLIQGAEDVLVDPRGNDEIMAAAQMVDKVKLVAPKGGHGSSAVETMVDELVGWIRARRQ